MNKRVLVTVAVALVSLGTLGIVISEHSVPTTTYPTSTVTSPPRITQPTWALWPFGSSPRRFDSPVSAARTFAATYLGIVNPIVGAYQAGDGRSGEVTVRATTLGAVTTILVQELRATRSWWVLGASCPDIVVASPSSSQSISSPVVLIGRSTAYEAVVNVDIRQDGTLIPLKRDRVMGGSMGVVGPFRKSITFPRPASLRGAIMFRTLSAKDGRVIEATAIRVEFLR